MTLKEFRSLLAEGENKSFRLHLPGGSSVPVSFHVTEVGLVQKTFVDCGGTLRQTAICQLQVWVGEDAEHQLETGKMAKVMEKAAPFLTDESIPLEIEYEDKVISQYRIESYANGPDCVVMWLSGKHTECLAPELCGLLAFPKPKVNMCCGPSGCC